MKIAVNKYLIYIKKYRYDCVTAKWDFFRHQDKNNKTAVCGFIAKLL